jgi:hypothetical protein
MQPSGSFRKSASLVVAAVAFVSLTFPFYHPRLIFPKQDAGRYFFFGQVASIDWSHTIHDFLWLSLPIVGAVWLVQKITGKLWIKLSAGVLIALGIVIAAAIDSKVAEENLQKRPHVTETPFDPFAEGLATPTTPPDQSSGKPVPDQKP